MKNKRAEAGLILYREGYTQKEIAYFLKATEKTVGAWKVKYNWDAETVAYSINKQTSEDNALRALAHQTKVIKLIADKLNEQITPDLDVKELSALLIPKGEIDAVQKLFTTIKRKELEWGDKIKIIREFISHVKECDIELSKQLVEHVDNYINDIRK